MKKKNGFTLIELLAVIIILGILMIIAIPSVTRYISDSRKAAYVDTAKQVASATKNLVNSGKLEMYDTNVAYYIPNTCIKVENGNKAKSPYGEFIDDKTYVVVTYDGKGYSYYWVSLDDTGTGVKEPISIDKLEEKDIETDLTRDDVKDNFGVEGKETVVIFNSTCASKIDKAAYIPPLCKRATLLHTEKCERTDAQGCRKNNVYQTGEYITYGSLGTHGTLSLGDAFDCDVNGDGVYDKNTERFYYVSPYYNTELKDYNNEYAVFIYSNYVYNKAINTDYSTIQYHSKKNNYSGPVSVVQHLPTKNQWKNVNLLKSQRQIISSSDTYIVSGYNLPVFDYENSVARLLTHQELSFGCNETMSSNFSLNNCLFMMENSKYSNDTNPFYGTWLETPYSSYNFIVFAVRGNSINVEYGYGSTINTYYGVRPVIEIPKSKIEI